MNVMLGALGTNVFPCSPDRCFYRWFPSAVKKESAEISQLIKKVWNSRLQYIDFTSNNNYNSWQTDCMLRFKYTVWKLCFIFSGVIALSWYPPGMADENGEPTDDLVPIILDYASKYNLKVKHLYDW